MVLANFISYHNKLTWLNERAAKGAILGIVKIIFVVMVYI
jgi:hypothetical protein